VPERRSSARKRGAGIFGAENYIAQEPPVTVFEDRRSPNVRELRQAQRRLSPAEVEALIADCEAGGHVG
jgi:hypothetical protein